LPESPGIYFLWAGTIVEYIGRSITINKRLSLGSHHVLTEDHQISFVLIERKYLSFAEHWYIGLVRPKLNDGMHATHHNL
jgi:hypothetical protein